MNKNLRYFLIGAGLILVGLILWYFKSIVAYILISAVLSLIGRPVIAFLSKIQYKKFHIPNSISAFLTLILLWTLLLTFFRVFIPLIAHQASELSTINADTVMENLKGPLEKIDQILNKYNIPRNENTSIDQFLTEKFLTVVNVSMLSNVFGSMAGLLGNIFIAAFAVSFITFFFLKDRGLLNSGILLFVPDKYMENTIHILASIKKLLTRYFVGIIVEVSGIIIIVSVGLTIVGIDFSNAMVIGLIAGLLNIIPYVGPVIGTCLGIIIGMAVNLDLPFYTELLPLMGYMLIVFVVAQVIDNVVFQPFIYSSSVNAHPMEIFLVIMMAGSMAGVTGMILAIPTYTILRVVAKEFFNNLKVVKKLTEKI